MSCTKRRRRGMEVLQGARKGQRKGEQRPVGRLRTGIDLANPALSLSLVLSSQHGDSAVLRRQAFSSCVCKTYPRPGQKLEKPRRAKLHDYLFPEAAAAACRLSFVGRATMDARAEGERQAGSRAQRGKPKTWPEKKRKWKHPGALTSKDHHRLLGTVLALKQVPISPKSFATPQPC